MDPNGSQWIPMYPNTEPNIDPKLDPNESNVFYRAWELIEF